MLRNPSFSAELFQSSTKDANAAPTGETHAGFRWDEAQQKVIMSGDGQPMG